MKKKRITNKRNEELDKKRWEKGRREEGGGNDKGRNIRNEWSNIKVYNQTKEKQKLTRGIQTKKKRRERKKKNELIKQEEHKGEQKEEEEEEEENRTWREGRRRRDNDEKNGITNKLNEELDKKRWGKGSREVEGGDNDR